MKNKKMEISDDELEKVDGGYKLFLENDDEDSNFGVLCTIFRKEETEILNKEFDLKEDMTFKPNVFYIPFQFDIRGFKCKVLDLLINYFGFTNESIISKEISTAIGMSPLSKVILVFCIGIVAILETKRVTTSSEVCSSPNCLFPISLKASATIM